MLRTLIVLAALLLPLGPATAQDLVGTWKLAVSTG